MFFFFQKLNCSHCPFTHLLRCVGPRVRLYINICVMRYELCTTHVWWSWSIRLPFLSISLHRATTTTTKRNYGTRTISPRNSFVPSFVFPTLSCTTTYYIVIHMQYMLLKYVFNYWVSEQISYTYKNVFAS